MEEALDPFTMLIEDIIEKVVCYATFDDLKRYRLINRLWNYVCSKELAARKSFKPIQVISSSFMELVDKDIYKICPMNNLAELTQTLKNSLCFPCKHFAIKTDAVQTITDERALQKFFEVIVNLVTELGIEDNGERLFPTTHLQSLTYDCLKSLSISVNKNADECSVGRNIMSATLLVKNAPNLETLFFQNKQKSHVASYFLQLLQDVQVSGLKTLRWIGNCEENHIKMLIELKLRLKTLVLGIPSKCEVSSSEIKILLESQQDTLENLTLYLNQSERQEIPTLPKLKNLKFGELHLWPLLRTKIKFPRIDYDMQLPALQNLVVCSMNHLVFDVHDFLNSGVSPSKLKIGLEFPDNIRDSDIVLEFVRIFPNLRRLKMTAFAGFVKKVCLGLEHLDELILWFPYVHMSLDEVVLPLVELTAEELSLKLEQPNQILDPSLVEPVMCLQNLRILRLEAPKKTSMEISDLAACRFLMKLRKLERLDLREFTMKEVRPSFRTEVEKKIKVDVVMTQPNRLDRWSKKIQNIDGSRVERFERFLETMEYLLFLLLVVGLFWSAVQLYFSIYKIRALFDQTMEQLNSNIEAIHKELEKAIEEEQYNSVGQCPAKRY